MKVLLTGGSGFIGRHVLDVLRQHEIPVALCGRHAPGALPNGVEFLRCDLLDTASVTSLCRKARATHLLHLAWDMSLSGGYWTSADNLRWLAASQHLMGVFLASGGRRLVGAGTGVEYSPVREPRDEHATPTNPDTVYGKAKLACGNALQAIAAGADCSGAWARLFYLLGPGEKPERLIPSASRALWERAPFCCKNGDAFLDYMDVRDAAQALVRLLLSDMQGAVNIASGTGRYVKDILHDLASLAGVPADFVFEAPQEQATPFVVARIERLRMELGFSPGYSLKQSLADCLSHARQNQGQL